MFGKVLTAMVTPMREDMSVNYAEAERLACYLADHGSDGIVVTGTTGEPATLTKDERLQMFEVVSKAVGSRCNVLANVGSYSTAESAALAKKAAQYDIAGFMAVVPYYLKPPQEGMYKHFQTIAEAGGKPLIMYNIPSRTGVNMLPETVGRLAEVPNVVGLKEATGNMDQMSEFRRVLPPDFTIYSGEDSLLYPLVSLGANGLIGVASHLVGERTQRMLELFWEGKSQEALQIHLELMPLFKGIFVTTNPIPIKYLLNKLGFHVGGCRLPLTNPEPEEKVFLDRLFDDFAETMTRPD
ncbi:MAG: 4-hydroxy-tetrahydrodipicolinate synthase [Peptococcaceae bacterium]|nr:4-hydroxy-tetrahydrodipicolinate synthase [Peptococcaceae bacterium]